MMRVNVLVTFGADTPLANQGKATNHEADDHVDPYC
jgi:hypothetical protein